MKTPSKAAILLLLSVAMFTSCNYLLPAPKTKPAEAIETALVMAKTMSAETQVETSTAASTRLVPPQPTTTFFPPTNNSGCGAEIKKTNIQNASRDGASLSEFIIGKWRYDGKYYVEGWGYADIFWQYTFVDERIVEVQAGPECRPCIYKFIEPELISIDGCSPPLSGVMKWSIKRDGQLLLIQRLDSEQFKGGEQLQFERVEE